MTTRTDARVSSSSVRRFARRQWSRRLVRIGPLLVLACVLVLAGLAVWVVAFSSLLDTRTVTVHGLTSASGLSPAGVRAAARVPMGEPLARVDIDAVHGRVAALLPVKAATVTRSWPHEVTIDVAERTAVAVWVDGASQRLVDVSGVAFRTSDGVRTALPRMEIRARGKGPVRTAELRATGARVSAALPAALVRRVTRVEVQTVDAVQLRLSNGDTVMWGSAEESAAKARVLMALLAQPAKVYDVSVPAFPTTRR